MNHLLLIILSIFLSLKEIHCQNVTDTTSEPVPTTTEMYTTLADLTVPDDEDPMDSEDDDECDYEYIGTIHDAEGIELTICAYSVGTGSDATGMIGVSVDLPKDRWVGVGFVTIDDYEPDNKMTDVYAIIVPPYSRAIQERALVANGDHGDELQSQITLYSDKYEDGRRILKLKRKATVANDDLEAENVGTVDKYFDFAKIENCKDEIKILWAFGAKENVGFSYHETNRGVESAKMGAIKGKSCVAGTDEANRECIITAIITIIAVVFH